MAQVHLSTNKAFTAVLVSDLLKYDPVFITDTEDIKWKKSHQVFLLVVKPWSSVFQVARSRLPSPPQMEIGEGEASLQWSSLQLAGAFWHWYSHKPTEVVGSI